MYGHEDENYTSIFHPYTAKELVVVRFAVTPVFDVSAADTPVGALIVGDIVNGKAYTVSMVQDEYSDGKLIKPDAFGV
jgi:hypothetical protein